MMKFSKLKYNLKKSKKFLIFAIIFLIVTLLDIALTIFNIAQIVLASGNSASLSNAFIMFNVIVAVINILMVLFIIVMPLIKRKN